MGCVGTSASTRRCAVEGIVWMHPMIKGIVVGAITSAGRDIFVSMGCVIMPNYVIFTNLGACHACNVTCMEHI